MKILQTSIIAFIFLISGSVVSFNAQIKNDEITNFMKLYLAGHEDTSLLPQLFAEDANVEGIIDKKFIHFSANEFLERTKNVKPSRFATRNSYRILESNKNTAVALANVYVEDKCFTDYLILANLQRNWKVVYKSFSDICER